MVMEDLFTRCVVILSGTTMKTLFSLPALTIGPYASGKLGLALTPRNSSADTKVSQSKITPTERRTRTNLKSRLTISAGVPRLLLSSQV